MITVLNVNTIEQIIVSAIQVIGALSDNIITQSKKIPSDLVDILEDIHEALLKSPPFNDPYAIEGFVRIAPELLEEMLEKAMTLTVVKASPAPVARQTVNDLMREHAITQNIGSQTSEMWNCVDCSAANTGRGDFCHSCGKPRNRMD